MESTSTYFVAVFAILCIVPFTVGWQSDSDRVLLNDLKVITLYHGRMTNARRSAPVPQMKCVGGSSGCQSFIPQVVQCYNRGTDGYDVQWECQTDMDNAYRFGQVEVSCEGFDYPDDPYVLKGSCGLEYSIDLTKEGHAQRKQGNQHSYYGDDQDNSYHSYTKANRRESSWLSNIISLAIICVVIYAIYVTCLSNNGGADGAGGAGGPTSQPHGYNRGHGSAPPPPGFRDEYMPGGGCSSNFDSTYTSAPRYNRATGAPGATGGGFWSGAATGGILGYMFGSRNTGYNTGYQRPYGSTWGGSGWGGSGWGGSGFGGGRSMFGSTGGGGSRMSASSGTRTASGFGGTKRR